jgi:glucose/arabinose dehydrogenase/PKD repeat protein
VLPRRRITRTALAATLLPLLPCLLFFLPLPPASAAVITLPAGFRDEVVFSGLTMPTNVEFAPDGKVFVAQKNGIIKAYSSITDPDPVVFADLSAEVHDQYDRGMGGLALAPNFPTDPSVYVMYPYDAPPGQTAPYWHDVCPNPNDGSCLITNRLSRLTADATGLHMTGSEQVLLSGWCQQYPGHSADDVRFGPDGALYVTAGEGASFTVVDYGQTGNPVNPCGDPLNQGGALRAQNVRSSANPVPLNGSLLRLNPGTGEAMPDNPAAGSPDPNARRIVGYGLRNPFRYAFRPGTHEVWLGDVGWDTWEEIDRVPDPTASVTNFGWPCYEGPNPQPGYQSANLALCQSLYSGAGQTAPYYAYKHSDQVVAGESCPAGGSAITGLAFYPTSGGAYPSTYAGALFFADYSRKCIWAMLPGADGLPDKNNIVTFLSGSVSPVDLVIGPGNDLYYVDVAGGAVHRIRYYPNDQPPNAVLAANPTSGSAPLTVAFDGTGSTDPDPGDQAQLTYAWDFGDGTPGATTPTVSHTYTAAGTYTAKLTVTDPYNATDTSTVTISAGNDAPAAVIDSPSGSLTWSVGDTISFSGHATDAQQGALPPSALTWTLILHHCVTLTDCHVHPMNTFAGVASGSVIAPDHDYPSYVEIQLTATDAGGLSGTASVSVHPKPVELAFTTNPAGLRLAVGSTSQVTPFTVTAIQGATVSVSAPTPQSSGGSDYGFCFWSDAGAQTHLTIAPRTATSYTATYNGGPCGPQPGMQLSLRSRANTRYVTAENGGTSALIANRSAVGFWEKFDVVDAGGGFVALRSLANGRFVTAEDAGAGPLIANRAGVGAWEKFQLVNNPDGSVSLKANANGRYVTAENAGGSALVANRTAIGAWEQFDPLTAPSAHTALKAHANGRQVSAESGGAAALVANRSAVSWWERFDIVDVGGGFVALRSVANGRFVTAEDAGAGPLIANRTGVGAWEKFQLVNNPDGSVSLTANANGRYVCADLNQGALLIANRTATGAWEEFDLSTG